MNHLRRQFTLMATMAAAGVLAGCAGAFEPLPANTAFGQPPANIEAPIRDYFESTLKDPESARFRFSTPQKAHANWGLIDGGKIRWVGYLVRVDVNAKNSFGGYVGFKPYMALFWGDERGLYRIVEGSSHPTIFYD